MVKIAQFLSNTRLGGFTIKARIYLGSFILVTFMAAIAGLSIWSISDLRVGIRDNGNLGARTVEVLEIERNVVDMLRNVEAFVTSGDRQNAERVKALGATITTGLDGLSDSGDQDAAQIDAMRGVVGAFGQVFDKVIQLSEKRRVLLEETMADYVDQAGKNIEEILSIAWNEGNTGIMAQAGQVQGNLLLAQLAVSNFVTDPTEKNATLATRKIKLVRKRMKSLLGRLSGNSDAASMKISVLGKAIVKETPAYRQAFKELVTTIQAIDRSLQGEMKGQTDRFAELSGEMKDTGVARLADRQAGMEAAISEMVQITMTVSVAALVVAMLTAWLLGRSVATPLGRMTGAMSKLAKGALDTVVPDLERSDEVGQMARAVQVFKDNAIEKERLAAEQAEEQAQREKRAAAIDRMTKDFDSTVSNALEAMSSGSAEMQSAAESMASTAEETSRQSEAAAAASEQASSNVQTVSSAAEEMSASINEIARQVSQSAAMAKAAVEEARKTNVTVQGLAEGSQKIGEVVEMISDIASQTNLLALNATIEAARAGDAGKGFAVVASEVKSLANQTAKATEQISAQIAAIQSSTDEAVGAIKGIGEKISEMDEVTTAIASAIEEQGASTGEISSNSQQAAVGTQEVSENITAVNRAATETGTAAGQVLHSAAELSSQAEKLRIEVDKFLTEVRAA